METTEWIWLNDQWVKWDDAKVHFLSHALHYGSAVFEGIRVYETERGVAIFRLQDHITRLFHSMKTLEMPSRYTQPQIESACIELVRRNKLRHGYIRPLAFFGYGVMGVNPRDLPGDVGIACWPWGTYLPYEAVDVKISTYIRIHPDSLIPDAKVSGHYVNSILASLEVRGTQYHESLFLDYRGFVAEGPGENFFAVKNGVVRTTKLGSILPGITRDTIMTLAKREGLAVEEVEMTPEEALSSDEAFYSGTAAEVTPIRSINGTVLGDGHVGPITAKLKDLYAATVRGKLPEYSNYLAFVEP